MFEFVWPSVFLCLPLPWLAWRYFPRAELKQQVALKIPFFTYLQQLASKSPAKIASGPTWRQAVGLLIWLLLISALAGPQWLGAPVALPQTGRDIMLAIDLSASMETPDLTLNGKHASRLDVVKAVADPFIEQRVGDRIGLVIFGSRAYLQAPLTFDRQTVRDMLDDASIGLAGPQTAIGDGLGLAIKRLLKYPALSRAIVLLTDGVNNTGLMTPLEAANVAVQHQIKIYTIGIGANSMLVPGQFGSQVVNPSSDLAIDVLKNIASSSGGKFFRAKSGDELRDIYHEIDKLEPAASIGNRARPITSLYFWPLAVALSLSMGLVVRHRHG